MSTQKAEEEEKKSREKKFYLTLPYSQTSFGSLVHQEIHVSTAQDCGQVYPNK